MRINILIRRYFVTGLLVTLPIAGTFFVLKLLLKSLEGILGNLLKTYAGGHYYPGLGIAVLIAGIFLVGLLTANVLGHWIVSRYEQLFKRLPLVRGIYSAIKSVVRTVSSQGEEKFKGVVLVEFPRSGSRALGFVVNRTEGEVGEKLGGRHLNLFVPTSPNPTSGFLMFVPEADVIYLSLSVEEAMKTIISGGIYTAGSGEDDSGVLDSSQMPKRKSGPDAEAGTEPRP
ncbi:MAG: DUF502 domain-containing protein [Nitrospirota bacterium]|nr:DUF502 domain-containing protein [Nitrospirota bacterium]